MSLKSLKKFANKGPLYLTNSNSKTYLYTYVNNTLSYMEVNAEIKESVEFSDYKDFSTIEELLENPSKIDEEPFSFDFDSTKDVGSITSTLLVKSILDFTKYYDTESYRTELSGIHFRSGSIFASDAVIIKLKKSKMFSKEINMILDFKPLLDHIGIDNKKANNTSKSLFSSKSNKNDEIKLSVLTKDGNDALKLEYKDSNFVIISIGKSELDFSFVKNLNTTDSIKIHRESLINKLSDLLKLDIEDSDHKKDYVRFKLLDKISLSNFIYYKEGPVKEQIAYDKSGVKTENLEFILDAKKLLVMLKTLKEPYVFVDYSSTGKITRVRDEKDNSLLLIAQTIYK